MNNDKTVGRRRRYSTTPITNPSSGYPKEEEEEDEDVDIEFEEEEEEEEEDDDEDYDDGSSKKKRKTKRQQEEEQEEEETLQEGEQPTLEVDYGTNGGLYSDEGDVDEELEEEEEEEELINELLLQEEMNNDIDSDSDDDDSIDDQKQPIQSGVNGNGGIDSSSQSQTPQNTIQDDQLFQTGDPGDDFLIPVRLEIQSSVYKIGDYLLWNLNEKDITPEYYSKRLCIELDYPDWFEQLITASINHQILIGKDIIKEFRKILPKLKQIIKECIITINLDLNVNGLYLKDRFEWDIIGPNLPESFSRSISMDLGLSREFENIICYSIREQIQVHYSQITKQFNVSPHTFKFYAPMRNTAIQHEQILRNDYQLSYYTPSISYRQPPKVGGFDPNTAYYIQQNVLKQQSQQQQQNIRYQLRNSTLQQQNR